MRKITKIRRSIKAISPVISVLLMIAIAVVASLVVYAWVIGFIGGKTTQVGQSVQIQSLGIGSNGHLQIYVQNVGQGAVTLDPAGSIYVNNTQQPSTITPTTTLNPGQTASIDVTSYALSSSDEITVKVVTGSGTYSQVTGSPGQSFVSPTASPTAPPTQYAVSFGTSGGGSGSTTSPTGSQTYNAGQQVTITATPDSGYTFSAWSATPSSSVTFGNANSASTTATINGAGTITATFTQTQTQYTVSFGTSGGGSGSTTSPTGSQTYNAGQQVTITATPDAGYTFSAWSATPSGSVTFTDANSASTTATINAASTITATFTQTQTQYQITVTQSSNGVISPGTGSYNAGSTPSFTITPNSGYHIASITANGASVTVNTPAGQTYQFAALSAAGTLTATYAANTFGYTTQGSSSTNGNLEDYIMGSIFTSPGYSVTAQSITAYIQVSNTHTIKAAIYTSTGTFVAGTQEVSVTTSNDGWVTFTITGGHQLTANTNYLLVVWSNSASGSANIYYTSSGGSGRYYQTTYATNWPTSPSFTNNIVGNYDYSIYCTYSIP